MDPLSMQMGMWLQDKETRHVWVICHECQKEYQLVMTDSPRILDAFYEYVTNDPSLATCEVCHVDSEIRLDRCPETVTKDVGTRGCILTRHHEGKCTTPTQEEEA